MAPIGCLAWSVGSGWMSDPRDIAAAELSGDFVWHVTTDRTVSIRGTATLASLAHLDRRITRLQREIDEQHGRQQ